ncbi:MAG: hypothetical protein JNK63_09850 [Chthonomonas sp.]|nr:hypothetical protein [Chthonomonas sp.]
MAIRTKRREREIPQIDGGWQGAASLPVVEMMRDDRYTMAEIATAFGLPLRTLYWKIDRLAKNANSNGAA